MPFLPTFSLVYICRVYNALIFTVKICHVRNFRGLVNNKHFLLTDTPYKRTVIGTEGGSVCDWEGGPVCVWSFISQERNN